MPILPVDFENGSIYFGTFNKDLLPLVIPKCHRNRQIDNWSPQWFSKTPVASNYIQTIRFNLFMDVISWLPPKCISIIIVKIVLNSIGMEVMYTVHRKWTIFTHNICICFKFSYAVYKANVATKQNTSVRLYVLHVRQTICSWKLKNFLNPSEFLTICRILLPTQLHFDEPTVQWKAFINYRITSLRWELNQTMFDLISFQLIFIDWNHALNVGKKQNENCKPE